VTRRFRQRGFVSLGKLPTERLGLSLRRSDELRLLQAWVQAAGSRLAAKATPLGIRRGVLELRMTADDDAWRRTLFEVVPGLAVSIAAAHPGLGIEAVRLVTADGKPVGKTRPIAGCKSVGGRIRSVAPDPESVEPDASRPLRLERVMRAYLSRSKPSCSGD